MLVFRGCSLKPNKNIDIGCQWMFLWEAPTPQFLVFLQLLCQAWVAVCGNCQLEGDLVKLPVYTWWVKIASKRWWGKLRRGTRRFHHSLVLNMFDLLKKTFKRQKHTTTYYHGRFHDFRQNFYPNVVPENSKTQLPERGRRWTGLTQDLLKSPMLVCTSIVVPTSVFEEKKGSTKEPTLQGTNISHLREKKKKHHLQKCLARGYVSSRL